MIPVLALWLAVGHRRELGIPSLASQWKAVLLALLVAAPWWLLNLKAAISLTRHARGFVANSSGATFASHVVAVAGHGWPEPPRIWTEHLDNPVVITALREAIVGKKVFLDPASKAGSGGMRLCRIAHRARAVDWDESLAAAYISRHDTAGNCHRRFGGLQRVGAGWLVHSDLRCLILCATSDDRSSYPISQSTIL